MTKLTTKMTLIMLLVCLGATMVLADHKDHDYKNQNNNINHNINEKIKLLGEEINSNSLNGNAPFSKIREQLKEKKQDLQEKNQELEEQFDQARAKLMEAKGKITKVKLGYNEANEQYSQAKKNYHQQKRQLIKLKQQTKACRKDCQQKNILLKRGLQLHLLQTNELMDRSVEKLLQRLDHAPITEQEKNNATATLLALQQKVTSLQEKIENSLINGNLTNEELREAIADVKSTWKEVKQVQSRIIAMLTQAKLAAVVDKHQEYLNGLDLRIALLKQENIDVTQLEIIRNQFEKHLQQFNLDFVKVEGIWQEAQSGRNVLQELHAGQQKLREQIVITKSLLNEFMSKFSELKPKLEE